MRVRTLEQAAKWVDEVGLALLYPNGDYVVPSLWEAATGHSDMDWEAPETWKVWTWKDELPAERLACVGLHVARPFAQPHLAVFGLEQIHQRHRDRNVPPRAGYPSEHRSTER